MKNKFLQIILHVLCCMAFLALPILFAPDSPVYLFQFDSYALHKLTLYILFIGFFYLNFFVLLPKLYFSKRYIIYFIACVTCFFIITYTPDLILPSGNYAIPQQTMMPPGAAPAPFMADVEQTHFQKSFLGPHISDNFFLFIIILFASMTIKINTRLKLSEKEKTEAQLSYLQSQINPHFLFNTLNSIYSLAVDEKSYDTASAIVKLSGMMRYTTTESGSDLVSLEKEISYISNYIELQKLRLGDTAHITYHTEGNFAGKSIVPLILIPFIENAFKHGVNPEEKSDIDISMELKGFDFCLTVINNKVYRVPDEAKSGVGIHNTKQRLEFLYPTRHTLTINNTQNTYKVTLQIDLE